MDVGVNLIEESFDAVYYARAAPSSLESLTLLALIFDKIYFPGVRVPLQGADPKAISEQIAKLRMIGGTPEAEKATHINLLVTALWGPDLRSFCVFPANDLDPAMPEFEDGAELLSIATQDLYFGPPSPGFFPTQTLRHATAIPGADDLDMDLVYPGIWVYPANALLYARRHGKVLVNDHPEMPVPGSPSVSPRGDAAALSLMLALEAVKFALPKLKAMEPKAIADFREETKQYVRPFRIAMLRLSKELNALLRGDESLEEVQRHARFLVETTVYPELAELSRVIQEPARPWYRRAVDLAKDAPELASAFVSMPTHFAVAKLLAKFAGALADYRDDQVAAEKRTQRGLYYLLRVQQLGR